MAPTTAEKLNQKYPDLEYVKLVPAEEHPLFGFTGFAPGEKTTIPKGHTKAPGRKSFASDTILERDVAITMRDGIKIYTDIFRPKDSDENKVPALMPWSPYGKTGTGTIQYEMAGPYSCGVPKDKTSGYDKFEAPDPAEWCARGYAIINVDSRGAGKSEGNMPFWGIQEAEDIYDTIDWLAAQPWCDGSVAMVGNSWLAHAQINFASRLKHPALKAMAPMEGFSDLYREFAVRGGKPHNVPFLNVILDGMAGPGHVENMTAMISKRPLFDDYWEDKHVDTSKIDVPMYITGSYSSMLHTAGSFRTFRTAATQQKWLRVHPYQEWSDLFRPEVLDDLQSFFDHFCKGKDNGWERNTPPLRLSLLGFTGSGVDTVVERAEKEYPLARQQLQTYFLDVTSHTLVAKAPASTSKTSHEGHNLDASSDFTLYFDKYTELAGYAKATLWMSCAEKDDMDVAVQIRKVDARGKLMEHLNYPCPVPVDQVPNVNIAKALGPQGFLRASHLVSRDETRTSKDGQEVFYKHDRREPIKPGTVVKLEITFWPMGMVFAEGEGLMLRVSGHNMEYPEFDAIRPKEADDENEGTHVIHAGGDYDSCLTLPVVSG